MPDYRPVPALALGESAVIDLWWGCQVGLEVGDDRELYIPDRAIVTFPGRPWRVSDLPPNWDVQVFDLEAVDGPSWVIRNVTATRVDDDALVVHGHDGALIAHFERDATPPDQRIVC